jgi:hypothetical protein
VALQSLPEACADEGDPRPAGQIGVTTELMLELPRLPGPVRRSQALREVARHSLSDYAEAVRGLRRHLDRCQRPSRSLVVAVAAEEGQDGASTLAVNLAQAFANLRRSALLVDANPARPISAVLVPSGAARSAEAMVHVVRSGRAPEHSLLVLPRTGGPPPGSWLRGVLRLMRAHFDVVIIDGMSEAALWGGVEPLADRVLRLGPSPTAFARVEVRAGVGPAAADPSRTKATAAGML